MLRLISDHNLNGPILRGLQRRGNCGQPVARTVTVELIEQFRTSAGEQHLYGVFFPAQDGAEFGAVPRTEKTIWQMTRVLPDEGAKRFLS